LVHAGQVAGTSTTTISGMPNASQSRTKRAAFSALFGVQTAAKAQRVVGEDADRTTGQPTEADHHRWCPLGLELLEGVSASSRALMSGCTS
jgi:hypothetical protein